jgi:hypothetical protein
MVGRNRTCFLLFNFYYSLLVSSARYSAFIVGSQLGVENPPKSSGKWSWNTIGGGYFLLSCLLKSFSSKSLERLNAYPFKFREFSDFIFYVLNHSVSSSIGGIAVYSSTWKFCHILNRNVYGRVAKVSRRFVPLLSFAIVIGNFTVCLWRLKVSYTWVSLDVICAFRNFSAFNWKSEIFFSKSHFVSEFNPATFFRKLVRL